MNALGFGHVDDMPQNFFVAAAKNLSICKKNITISEKCRMIRIARETRYEGVVTGEGTQTDHRRYRYRYRVRSAPHE